MVLISGKKILTYMSLLENINILNSYSFNINIYSLIQKYPDSIIGYIKKNNKIVGAGFANTDPPNKGYKYKTMFLYNFSTHPDYQGKGICKQLVNEFIFKYGKTHILYLQVRTDPKNINYAAIKCYESNNFILLPQANNSSHYDGLNSIMIRVPHKILSKKSSKRSRK